MEEAIREVEELGLSSFMFQDPRGQRNFRRSSSHCSSRRSGFRFRGR
ncbi:CotG/ExsB N-terminal domain-containing protein [Bacillus sp. ISL-75]